MVRFTSLGSKLNDHGPFYQFGVQIDRSRSVLSVWGLNWSIMVHFTSSGSKLNDHGPFYQFGVQIGESRSVLLVWGPN